MPEQQKDFSLQAYRSMLDTVEGHKEGLGPPYQFDPALAANINRKARLFERSFLIDPAVLNVIGSIAHIDVYSAVTKGKNYK